MKTPIIEILFHKAWTSKPHMRKTVTTLSFIFNNKRGKASFYTTEYNEADYSINGVPQYIDTDMAYENYKLNEKHED